MLRRRFPIGLVAPIALVVLIAALGALQYRWVGQVSERERDQLRQSLDRRAAEFADDFDHEIGWDGAKKTMYHYHLTKEFPYTVGCFKGTKAVNGPLGGGGGPPPR